MSLTYRIAQPHDSDLIYNYAHNKLKMSIPDEMELMMKVWESNFRKEALEHYLKLGWSFIAEDSSGKIAGFFLGQPFLFVDAQTQTLWVECLQADNFKIESELADIAIKLSRDKHLQRVILPDQVLTLHFDKPYNFQKWSEKHVWVKTTK